MANQEQRQELEEKISALATSRFGGDYRAAFGHYDSNGDGEISKDELKALLADAGIGNGLTRWAWAKGIVEELDASDDGTISWDEFETVVQGGTS